MDGENNGNPYEQIDDLGVPLFFGKHPYISMFRNCSGLRENLPHNLPFKFPFNLFFVKFLPHRTTRKKTDPTCLTNGSLCSTDGLLCVFDRLARGFWSKKSAGHKKNEGIIPLKIGHPKRKFHVPTLDFQGLSLVSGRVARKNPIFLFKRSKFSQLGNKNAHKDRSKTDTVTLFCCPRGSPPCFWEKKCLAEKHPKTAV